MCRVRVRDQRRKTYSDRFASLASRTSRRRRRGECFLFTSVTQFFQTLRRGVIWFDPGQNYLSLFMGFLCSNMVLKKESTTDEHTKHSNHVYRKKRSIHMLGSCPRLTRDARITFVRV